MHELMTVSVASVLLIANIRRTCVAFYEYRVQPAIAHVIKFI